MTQMIPHHEHYNFDYEKYYLNMLDLLRNQGFELRGETSGEIFLKGKFCGSFSVIDHPETKIYRAHQTYQISLSVVVPAAQE